MSDVGFDMMVLEMHRRNANLYRDAHERDSNAFKALDKLAACVYRIEFWRYPMDKRERVNCFKHYDIAFTMLQLEGYLPSSPRDSMEFRLDNSAARLIKR